MALKSGKCLISPVERTWVQDRVARTPLARNRQSLTDETPNTGTTFQEWQGSVLMPAGPQSTQPTPSNFRALGLHRVFVYILYWFLIGWLM